ncbi:malic enzyme [Chromatiales bacterium (ex Bugula neritina AB1)]|nr:malic enzyme [Chromatiales bacterium (ex Bugula neritina AB1)]
MADELRDAALQYHRYPKPGKLEISATKNMVNQRDLALAYSPGVAIACEEIVKDSSQAAELTARANLVGVITNGTAVLGLGAIGPLASKPVMEGKAVLFKKFADIDVFDLELDTTDVDRFVDAVSLMEPCFGGINLEDIKAPECFEIEKQLNERMNIPVFHDDQHGTAITVAAAITNGLLVAEKKIEEVNLVCSGAGAAALACLDLLVSLGLKKSNITVVDIDGVVYEGRTESMDIYKSRYARDTGARVLADVISGADIFLGLSAAGVLKPDHVKSMADTPLIFALANPIPEIMPELATETRGDAIIATGRSDYPNQVNNVLCFPFLFRGALDVGATTINQEMKIAAVEAIAEIATREVSDVVASAYGDFSFSFGRHYLIPKPFDPRLMTTVPTAVAKAAMDSGVATRPIEDFAEYRNKLKDFVFKSGLVMKPVFEKAMSNPQRVVFSEGESRRVINAVQVLVDDGICKPILLGRPSVIEENIRSFRLRLTPGEDFTIIDPMNNPDENEYADAYHAKTARNGVTPAYARAVVRTRATALASLMVNMDRADALICGTEGAFIRHLNYLKSIVGIREDVSDCSAVILLVLQSGTFFLTDTHVSVVPSAEHIAETAALASTVVQRFGMTPKIALLSHSNFGSRDNKSSKKMRLAREIIERDHPQLLVEGEMHADAAVKESVRNRIFPDSRYTGSANLMVMPNLDTANIAYNMVKVFGDGLPVGPMLVGLNKPAHVLTEAVTVRGIVNMCAVAAAEAIEHNQ